MSERTAPASEAPPRVELAHLDNLWFQVTGTICNLRCSHCFISCAPDNHSFGFLDLATVERWLEAARAWGVKEYYVTGGEPFMHERLPEMLERMLELGPVTVLTNGTLLQPKVVGRLGSAARASQYSLEIRVSVDGSNPAENDPIRGAGTFERAMKGVELLLRHDLLPIITAARVWDELDEERVVEEFFATLRSLGYDQPRLKILPTLKIGREACRSAGYDQHHWVTEAMLDGFDEGQLLCANSRIITSRGIHVCPILIDDPRSLMGSSLEEAAAPYALAHQACYTCWLYGAICSNYGGVGEAAT